MDDAWHQDVPPDSLRRAVNAAAHDAREKLMRAEELLLAFKALEARITAKRLRATPPASERHRLIKLLIEAYYGD